AVWVPFSRGSSSTRYYGDQYIVVKWNKDGSELAERNREVNGQTAQARQGSEYYFRPGGTYSLRAKAFSVRALPRDCVIDLRGPAILSESDTSADYLIAWLNSGLIGELVHLQANKSQFNTGILKRLP